MTGSSEVIVRRMEETDLSEVCAIENAAFSLPWSRESFLSSMRNDDHICLTALCENEVAGYGVMLCSFDEGEIALFAVREDLRRSGIGSKLLETLMEKGREKGAERFTLEVRKSNDSAIRLYEKFGFKSVGVRKGFYEKPREDALIMWT